MILDVIRYMRGYVEFNISGRFPERFLNITSRNGIHLWNVQRSSDNFSAAMLMSDYKRIRSIARSAAVRLRITKKRGIPVTAHKYRDRVGIVIGAFMFLLTVFIMSQFIWSIDITGLDSISESEMRSMLAEHGMYVGAFKPMLDYGSVSRAVMLDNSKVGWMAINVTGSYASVELKEEYPTPDISDMKEPTNVKARRDGTIIRVEAGEGKTLLKNGSGVVEGQLVVSGVMEDQMGGVRLVRANASIIAATSYHTEISVAREARVMSPVGDPVKRDSVSLFGLRLPLIYSAADSPYALTDTYTDSLLVLDTTLPIYKIRESVQGFENAYRTLDNNSAKELLTKQAQLYEVFSLSGCEVTSRSYKLKPSGDEYILSADYECVEDIAVQIPIGVDDNTIRLREKPKE